MKAVPGRREELRALGVEAERMVAVGEESRRRSAQRMGLAAGWRMRSVIRFDHASSFGVIGRQIDRRGGERIGALIVAVVIVVAVVVAVVEIAVFEIAVFDVAVFDVAVVGY